MILKFKIKNLKFNSGSTIVETLVAISILTLSILGAFTAVQGSLQKSYYAKDQATAFYLIQEAVEYIRNIRDNNGMANIAAITTGGSVNWLKGIATAGDACIFGNWCYIDSPLDSKTACSPNTFANCPFIKQDSTTGLFGYTNGTATKFKRAVQLTPINANEIVITVQVDWTSGVFSKSIQVKQSLFNVR